MTPDREVTWSAPARRDYQRILRRTLADFGHSYVEPYQGTLEAAVDALRSLIEPRDSRPHGVFRRLHVQRRGRRGSHIVFYRIVGPAAVEVVRILHEPQDFDRHLPGREP